MKVYKIELMIVDHDGMDPDEIKGVIENQRYPNHCINPRVINTDVRDIGEWHDKHPLNLRSKYEDEFKKIFHKDSV